MRAAILSRRARAVLVLLGLVACAPEPDRPDAPAQATASDERQTIEDLEALGYFGGEVEDTGQATGVTVNDVERVQPGLNFVVSAHVPGAALMDEAGVVLHRWERAFREIWPDVELPKGGARMRAGKTEHWRCAHLYSNGDVLAVFEGLGIARLDRDSNVVWASYNRAHHDVHVTEAGEIYTLTRRAHVLPRVHPTEPILEDFVTVLSAGGDELRSVSVLECFENSAEFGAIWTESGRKKGDLFHTNSVELLDGRAAAAAPAFGAGRVLTSLRALDVIAVLDLDAVEVVWAFRDDFVNQHDPKIVETDHLLLFDNQARGGPSRILEYDLATMERVWSYAGTDEAPFYSQRCGVAERLANGNTLVTESMQGRAFELDPAGEIVWEYRNPGRVDDGLRVAQLFEVVRLEPDFPFPWE